ncbi:HD domain-containing protein [Atopobacter sp. AH10]|uniref:HD domain-containing protein n=1 Tax=Atopobacter sp. AH10 TaxID=2315861 RepID=UPI000EF18CA2|nr:HD domain-containing protein [Atopobacter sp. AH10]RLK63129.1 HD domain-containing protein [Atopobacter sp. AH10]
MYFYSPTLKQEKVFRDPIHDHIHIQHQLILDIINCREFQRLRRIKQTGTSLYTFHGAEHSRFGHCVGVYEIARRICDHFKRNYPSQKEGDGLWDDRNRILVLCAALLHDLGHGPFSHAFEKIFQTNHEDITVALILSEETEVHQVLARVHPDFPKAVASIIQKTHPNKQLVQLISSQIDADRMDYLLRDAYYTGVNYGRFDLSRILRVMLPKKNGIAFHLSGMHAVEDYVLSRYQMYMQVYFHPVSRGVEVLLNHLLKRAKYDYGHPSHPLHHSASLLAPFFTGDWSLEDYLKLDDGVLSTYFTHWLEEEDPILSDLAGRFLSRKPFKSVAFDQEKDQDKIDRLTQIIKELGYDTNYYTALNSSYDLPYDFYRPGQKKNRTEIELLRSDGQFIELSLVSEVVHAITGKARGDNRFYFPREILYPETNSVSLFNDLIAEFQQLIQQLSH